MKLFRALSIIFLIAFISIGCGSSGGGGDNGGPENPPGSSDVASADIEAKVGGTITTGDGISLTIPPNALEKDTRISVSSVDTLTFDSQTGTTGIKGLHIIGAIFEPDGTMLDSPATVRFPLPPDWNKDEIPVLYETHGSNPVEALPGSTNVVITGEPGKYFAEIAIRHFSTKIISENCHAGTLRRIIENFQDRGCSKDQIYENVNTAYDGITVNDANARTSTPGATQAFINTYFDDFGTFNGSEDVPADKLSQILGYVSSGRQVVLAFSSLPEWPERTGQNNFFPSGAFAHTAVLELDHANQVQMHHTITHPLTFSGSDDDMSRLVEDLGGELHYTYPAGDLNKYRKLQAGVAFEKAVCGEADCLSDKSKNDYGLGIYNPLDGDWKWDWGYHKISDPRPVAYPSVHIYVERIEGSPLGSCESTLPSATYKGTGTSTNSLSTDIYGSASCPSTATWEITLYNEGLLAGQLRGTYSNANPQDATSYGGVRCVDSSDQHDIYFGGTHSNGTFEITGGTQYYDYTNSIFLSGDTPFTGTYNNSSITAHYIYVNNDYGGGTLTLEHEFNLPKKP